MPGVVPDVTRAVQCHGAARLPAAAGAARGPRAGRTGGPLRRHRTAGGSPDRASRRTPGLSRAAPIAGARAFA